MKKLLMIFAVILMASPAAAQLVITGLYDGPLTGGLPKGIELYACDDIADLSIYGVGSANNGGGTDGVEYTFPADFIAGGTTFYVASDSSGFYNFFGFVPEYFDTGYALSINGDDAVELFYIGGIDPVVVDVFGDINVDGTGQPWDHLDGWAKRISGTGPDGSVFNLASWTFSGTNVFDGELTNDTAAVPFPLGGFVCDPAVDTENLSFGNVKSLFR